MIFDLAVVVRSALAKAVAALNHAKATTSSEQADVVALSRHFVQEVSNNYFDLGTHSQELTNAVSAVIFGLSATLDEQNLWGISYDEEFEWDYQVVVDELVLVLAATLSDVLTTTDVAAASIVPPVRADSFSETDAKVANTLSYFAEGTTRTYFAADYAAADYNAFENAVQDYAAAHLTVSLQDGVRMPYFAEDYAAQNYGVTDNYVEDSQVAAQTSTRSDTSLHLDAYTGAQAGLASDASSQADAQISAMSVMNADILAVAELAVSAQTSTHTDVQTFEDAKTAATQSHFIEGERTYFASDYAAEEYNAREGSVEEVVVSDIQMHFVENQRTYFAGDYAAEDYNAREGHVAEVVFTDSETAAADVIEPTDSLTLDFTYPAWADAAVPVDDISIALVVAAQDSSATSEGTSATIQNYALDYTYFAGDYATLPY